MGKLAAKGPRRLSPALAIACVALFLALCGGVYAAAKIDGHSVRTSSMPGNRIVPGSLPGNRLKPGALPGSRLAPGSVTGEQVDSGSLGQVPAAAFAERAESAVEAKRALAAEHALDATRVNGYGAGCAAATREFAGACWGSSASAAALSAAAAALACAEAGGELPSALALAAFAAQPGVELAEGGEWSGDVTNVSGANLYGVVTVSPSGVIDFASGSTTKKFRCVIPLVS